MLFVLGLNSKGNASLTFFYCWVDPQLSLVTIHLAAVMGAIPRSAMVYLVC